MLKKILSFTIIILVLIAIAVGVQIYLDQTENRPATDNQTTEGKGIFGFLGFGNNESNTIDDFVEVEDFESPRPTTIPTLRKISDEPVAGAAFVGTSTIRYVARGNGHIYDIPVNSYETRKISNTTIPRVYRSYFLPSKNSVVYQQLEEGVIKSRLLGIEDTGSTTPGEIQTISFLPDNIRDIAMSPTTNEFAYLDDTGTVTVDSDTFKLPGKSWDLEWRSLNTFSLTTLPSANSLGYNYESSRNGSLKKVLGGIRGLTSKSSPDFLLYASGLNLKALNLEDRSVVSFENGTLPEKCVLIAEEALCGAPNNPVSGIYPDSWYQGLTSFNDEIVAYDLETGDRSVIYTPGEQVDVIWPEISIDGKYLLFVNKTDLSLWVLNLES